MDPTKNFENGSNILCSLAACFSEHSALFRLCCVRLRNLRVVLKWNLPNPLLYSVKFLEKFAPPEPLETLPADLIDDRIKVVSRDASLIERFADGEWIAVEALKESGLIVLSITQPNFIEGNRCLVDGVIAYEVAAEDYRTTIEEIEFSALDTISTERKLKMSEILNGGISYLVLLGAADVFSMEAVMPEDSHWSLTRMLASDCYFVPVNTPSKASVYAVKFDEWQKLPCLFRVEKLSENHHCLKIHAKSEKDALFIVHYLYKISPNVRILPKGRRLDKGQEERQPESPLFQLDFPLTPIATGSGALDQEFCESMLESLREMEKFLGKCNIAPGTRRRIGWNIDLNHLGVETYRDFRLKLASREKGLDEMYEKLLKEDD